MEIKTKRFIKLSIILLALFFIGYFSFIFYHSSQNKKSSKEEQSVNVPIKETNVDTNLYFSGTIAPLSVENVIAPIAGTISKIGFQYGQKIKSGQFLVDINSTEAQKNYREALTNYLKAKDTFLSSNTKTNSQKELFNDGLIARNDYEGSISEFENNKLSYNQAIYDLKNNIEKITSDKTQQTNLFNSLSNLHLGDKKVDKALNFQFSDIKIFAKTSGIALLPNKAGQGENEKLSIGSSIKEGDSILSIGNLSGYSIDINVSEMNVNQIKPLQKAIVTGVAFPGINLQGYVASVGNEGKSTMGGGTPSFPVKIIIPKITDTEKKLIHIGMSAQIQLVLTNPNSIMVPLSAVEQTPNGNYVTIMRNGSKQKVKVTTGLTTENEVAITSGLTPGDQIVNSH